jgi:hypothetical protein
MNNLLVIDKNTITEKDIFTAIDGEVVLLRKTNDVTRVTSAILGLGNIEKVVGKAKAKLLWNTQEWWKETNQESERGDTFEDYILAETGTTKTTTKRYSRTWGYIEDYTIPKEVAVRPMRELIPISNALSQGYEFEKDDWNKIKRAANEPEIREIVKEVTGKTSRKSGMTLKVDADGSLNAWNKNQKHFVGYLDVNTKDEVSQKAIRRIIENSGIQEN